jgi:hypothetical protein
MERAETARRWWEGVGGGRARPLTHFNLKRGYVLAIVGLFSGIAVRNPAIVAIDLLFAAVIFGQDRYYRRKAAAPRP